VWLAPRLSSIVYNDIVGANAGAVTLDWRPDTLHQAESTGAHAMRSQFFVVSLSFALLGFLLDSPAAAQPSIERQVVLYREPAKFGGWPANHGMWSWDNEILVGFSVGFHKDLGQERHNIDREKPEYHVLARSLDGGLTWTMEYPAEKGMLINAGGMRHGTTDPAHREREPTAITDPIDFTHPDFCMTMRFQDVDRGTSRLYYSYDRGRQWKGPYLLPKFGQPGIMARTDYIVNGKRDCHVFLTASKLDLQEGRVVCGRTTDGGLTWKLLSRVGPEPQGFSIMPSTVRLGARHLVTSTRRRSGPNERRVRWIDAWESLDDGRSWEFLNNVVADVGEGNPPALIQLSDGRLCLTYGDRKPPFEVRAQFSSDGGHSWSSPWTLSAGGGGRDMGYPRTLQRPDGKVVTVYYEYTPTNIYRRITATIWDPGTRLD